MPKRIFSLNNICLALAVLLPVAILLAVRLAYVPDGCENSVDAYWHVGAARRGIVEMTSKSFPMTLSVWHDSFADKELGFHLLLKLYTEAKELFSSPLAPPFNGASLLLLLIMSGAFVFAARRFGLSPAMTLLASLTASLLTPGFIYRQLVVRPHVFSMALMLIAYVILAMGPAKRKTIISIFLFSMLYAWSYSSPHLIWIPAFMFALGYMRVDGVRSFYSFFASVAGVFAGLTLHPQFPNTFVIWKIQAWDALLAPLSGGGAIAYASELQTPSLSWLLHTVPLFIIAYFCLMSAIRVLEKKQFASVPPELVSMFLLAMFWSAAAAAVSIRPVEYGVQVTVLAFFMLLSYAKKTMLFPVFETPEKVVAALCVFALITSGVSLFSISNSFPASKKLSKSALVERLRELAPAGTKVLNPDWGDFPTLYFAAPEYEYTWGLDPMFSFAKYPKQTRLISMILRHDRFWRSSDLRRVVDAEYAVLSERRRPTAEFLHHYCSWELAYSGPDGYIFKLKKPGGQPKYQ